MLDAQQMPALDDAAALICSPVRARFRAALLALFCGGFTAAGLWAFYPVWERGARITPISEIVAMWASTAVALYWYVWFVVTGVVFGISLHDEDPAYSNLRRSSLAWMV